MNTIYLIRHAEAEGNLYRRAHGQYNSLITENGYAQIKALAERFRDIPIDTVWSSDLFRTMTTARAILEPHNLSLNTHQGLREINMGLWEDKSWGLLQREDPQGMAEFSASSRQWHVEHGESFLKLTDRISKTITELAKQQEGKTVAIFCHGLAIRQFLSWVQGLGEEEWASTKHGDNTSVSKLSWDGTQFHLDYASDNSHLSDEISTFARQKWWRKESGGLTQDRNLWFQPLETREEEREYQTAVLQVWGAVPPGNTQRKTIYLACYGEEVLGWVSMGEDGELLLLTLKPEYQGDRLGLQLLGQAVSHGRGQGHTVLFLRCPPGGDLGFFQKFGFVEKGDRWEKYMGYQPRQGIL